MRETPNVQVPYIETLVNLRVELERRVEKFPFLKCQVATRLVHYVLGLEEVGGFFEYPDCMEDDWHAWNCDVSRGIYVDLTMDQYKGINRQITIVPINTRLLEFDSFRTKEVKHSSDEYLITKYGLEEVIKKYSIKKL
ncbi:hypothetical protein JXM83_01835 [Candidatus Woesearchaeota archaeon]|nr:hypothetical protein [Candidatus Woesearchaeota archaeon]